MNKQIVTIIMALSAGLLLAACGGPEEPESVEERAQARWDRLVEREFGEAWAFYTPGFRQTTSREAFTQDMLRRQLRWLDAEVTGSRCEEDRCKVSVMVTYQAVSAPAGQSRMRLTREIEDDWIRLDGDWWYATN